MASQQFIQVFILLGGVLGIGMGLVHLFKQPRFSWDRPMAFLLLTFASSNIYMWLLNWRGFAHLGDQQLTLLRLLLLLPLNPVLLPIFFLLNYIRQFTRQTSAFITFSSVLKWMALAEVLIALLPFGAALYTSFDRGPISFSLSIRRIANLVSLPFAIGTAIVIGKLLSRYRQSLAHWPDEQSGYRIRWVRHLLIAFVVVLSLIIAPLIYRFALHRPGIWTVFLQGFIASLVLAWMSIRSLLIDTRLLLDNPTEPVPAPAGPPAPAQRRLYEDALRCLISEQLYKNPSLKLSDLAYRLTVSPNYLSRVINLEAKKNFNDWLNEHRVEEVKRLMNDPAFGSYTLEGLGREAGFGAKSTYQASFKRLTGLTPSQYRANQRPGS